MTTLRGNLVWWTMPETATATTELLSVYKKFAPRNNSKTVVNKAVKSAKKQFQADSPLKAIHLKSKDNNESTTWEIYQPETGEDTTAFVSIAKIVYNKQRKSIAIDADEEIRQYIVDQIPTGYESIDSVQLAQMTRRILCGYGSQGCHAVSMRATGGIYFVPTDRSSQLLQLKEWVAETTGKLYTLDIYSSDDDMIEASTTEFIMSELEDEIRKLRAGQSEQQIKNRIHGIQQLQDRASAHQHSLRTAYTTLTEKINRLAEVARSVDSETDRFSLERELDLILGVTPKEEVTESVIEADVSDDLSALASLDSEVDEVSEADDSDEDALSAMRELES